MTVFLQDRAGRRFIPAVRKNLPPGRIAAMRLVLEFPDSEVRDVTADAGAVRVRFSAASVRAADGERGWLPAVALTLSDATLDGDAAHAFGKLSEGRLRLDGQPVASLELPATLAGDIDLALRFANGTSLSLRGRALALAAADGARFAADLSC